MKAPHLHKNVNQSDFLALLFAKERTVTPHSVFTRRLRALRTTALPLDSVSGEWECMNNREKWKNQGVFERRSSGLVGKGYRR